MVKEEKKKRPFDSRTGVKLTTRGLSCYFPNVIQ